VFPSCCPLQRFFLASVSFFFSRGTFCLGRVSVGISSALLSPRSSSPCLAFCTSRGGSRWGVVEYLWVPLPARLRSLVLDGVLLLSPTALSHKTTYYVLKVYIFYSHLLALRVLVPYSLFLFLSHIDFVRDVRRSSRTSITPMLLSKTPRGQEPLQIFVLRAYSFP